MEVMQLPRCDQLVQVRLYVVFESLPVVFLASFGHLLVNSSIPCSPDQYRRCLHCTSSSIFTIGPVNGSSHLCFHILKRLYRLSSVLQSMEGPLSINEVVAILLCSINRVVHSSTSTSVAS